MVMRAWSRLSLSAQVFIGLLAGIAFGFAFPKAGVAIKPIGDLFLNLIRMIILPLILTAIVTAVAQLKDIRRVGRIGIIALVGIVTKNGILIVEFANQRKSQGLVVREAVIDAAVQRFRPILMTSLATVFGVLPIALALGAAAKSRVSMGIVIIGGLLFSLGLTLYVIPALYTYITRDKSSIESLPVAENVEPERV